MDSRELVAKRLGISPHMAEDLLAPECTGNRLWTKADIADAVREWTERHGERPRDLDWRSGPGVRLPRLHGSAAKWPDCKTVRDRFDSWDEAAFFAMSGREWNQDVIDPDDPTAELRSIGIREALGRLLRDFVFDVTSGRTPADHQRDPRWGLPS
jgi:hypothetical protein